MNTQRMFLVVIAFFILSGCASTGYSYVSSSGDGAVGKAFAKIATNIGNTFDCSRYEDRQVKVVEYPEWSYTTRSWIKRTHIETERVCVE